MWDRATGEPIGPALGWQDLRTVGECITAKAEHGLALAPNQSATKLAWLLANVAGAADRDLCFGTVDTWLAWSLTGGARARHRPHQRRRHRPAAAPTASAWNDARAATRSASRSAILPALVDSTGVIGDGHGAARRAADRRARRRPAGVARRPGLRRAGPGQDHVRHRRDARRLHRDRPRRRRPAAATTAPSRSSPGRATATLTWGTEAIMLSAGTNVEWLRDDLGLIATSADEPRRRRRGATTTDGVVYVPALLGLGTPQWDYGARGTLLGLTRGTSRAHVVRAVLEGVAHRGADLVEAAEADTGLTIDALRVDGGMSANPTFVQALADATGRPVEVSPVAEATTLGAAFLAGLATGAWDDIDDADRAWTPARVVEPGRAARPRGAGRRAVERAAGWIPELSALDF